MIPLPLTLHTPVRFDQSKATGRRGCDRAGNNVPKTGTGHAPYDAELRRCPRHHTPNAIITAPASANQVMAYCR